METPNASPELTPPMEVVSQPKGHSPLPIILFSIGGLLVGAAIVFFIMQARVNAVAEEKMRVESEAMMLKGENDAMVTETMMMEEKLGDMRHHLLSGHIQLNAKGMSEPGENLIPSVSTLAEMLEGKDSTCTKYTALLDTEYYTVTYEELQETDAMDKLSAILPEALRTDEVLRSITHNTTSTPDQICIDGNTVIHSSLSEDYSRVFLTIFSADEGEVITSYLDPFGVIDGYYRIFTNALEGQTIVTTGYGDAGYVWWSYFLLDLTSKSSDLIERCTGNYVYDESAENFTVDSFEWSCPRRYISETK